MATEFLFFFYILIVIVMRIVTECAGSGIKANDNKKPHIFRMAAVEMTACLFFAMIVDDQTLRYMRKEAEQVARPKNRFVETIRAIYAVMKH